MDRESFQGGGEMNSKLALQIRLGKISYLNCLPFYHGLAEREGAEIVYHEAYPTKLNLALRRGRIDVAPVSSLEYLNRQKEYVLLPDLAIGARDFSGSVLLLSNKKIEYLDGASIALSRQSASSAAMLRILMRFKYKYHNKFTLTSEKPAQVLDKFDAALVIGDEALFFEPEKFVFKYDLSELWWNWTEKPFCFAVWAARKSFAAEHPDALRHLYRTLKVNRDRNLTDIEALLRGGLNMSFLDARFPKIYGYFFNLNFHLDETMKEGLELFYRLAHRLRLSPRPARLEFLGS